MANRIKEDEISRTYSTYVTDEDTYREGAS